MAFIITPQQLNQRAEFYHQLGAFLSAGVGLPQALEFLRANPPAHSFREPLAKLIGQLTRGQTFTESLRFLGTWIPSFDIALLEAGEQSGRLDACFKLLAAYYRERAQLTRSVIGDLGYPFFVLHFAVFIFPFPELFQTGNVAHYLLQTLGILAPIYGGIFFLIYACQGKHGERWRAKVENVIHRIPVLGAARRHLALARLAAALEALITAGVTIFEAWELAGAASGSPALRATIRAWKPQLIAGQTPAQRISNSPDFPEFFANAYHAGEISGKLDDSLRRLYAYYQEEGSRKLRAVAQWAPRLIYFGIMLYIAYKIVSFYSGYFRQVSDVMHL